jgi:uncharacterized protein
VCDSPLTRAAAREKRWRLPGPATAPVDGAPAPTADPPRTLVGTWALAIALLAAATALARLDGTGLLAGNVAGVAAFLFIWLPDRRLRARDEGWDAYGLAWAGARDPRTWRAWGRGAAAGVLACAVVFPPFVLPFWKIAEVLPHLRFGWIHHVIPYADAGAPRFALRLPERLGTMVLVQLLAVALPEELFYRGWMQTSWRRAAEGGVGTRRALPGGEGAPEPPRDAARGVTVLGARLGAGFLWTQALFAVGHLVRFQPWRLATFFPGLLFGWLRERTGGLAAPVVAHALSNLLIATLEASFYR